MDRLLSVEWNEHNSTFSKSLSCLRKQQLYTDATIACERKFYRVHKLVLSTCSNFFRDLLTLTDCANPIIVLKDIKYENFEALLDYMYIGVVQVRNSDFNSFIEAAKCLEIKGIGALDMEDVRPETHLQQHNSVVENLDNTQHTTQESNPLYLSVPVFNSAMEDWECRVKTNDRCSDGSLNIRDCNDGTTTGANIVESEGDQKYYLPTFPQQITLSPSQHDTFGNYSIAASSSVQHVEMIDGQIGGSTGSFPRAIGISASTATSISPSSNSENKKRSESMNSGLVDKQIGFGLKCKVCDKWFPSKSHMARHERTHTGDWPYRCNICDYAATNLENFKRHIASKHKSDLLPASRV